jgi:hypothetical protein
MALHTSAQVNLGFFTVEQGRSPIGVVVIGRANAVFFMAVTAEGTGFMTGLAILGTLVVNQGMVVAPVTVVSDKINRFTMVANGTFLGFTMANGTVVPLVARRKLVGKTEVLEVAGRITRHGRQVLVLMAIQAQHSIGHGRVPDGAPLAPLVAVRTVQILIRVKLVIKIQGPGIAGQNSAADAQEYRQDVCREFEHHQTSWVRAPRSKRYEIFNRPR